MYKDKEKQREATRKAVQKHRVLHQGITSSQGITSYPAIIDKLVDPMWRPRLERICSAFKNSHHPSYIQDVWLGDYNLSTVGELLECTG